MNRMNLETMCFSKLKGIFLKTLKYILSRINLAGMGVGNGWMSPYHEAKYGEMLYQVGLVDARGRDECLSREAEIRRLIDQGEL